MKPLQHHVHRFIQRMVDAEKVATREEAQYVVAKAEKHKKKIRRWHRILDRLLKKQ
jgi:hypothetical protein